MDQGNSSENIADAPTEVPARGPGEAGIKAEYLIYKKQQHPETEDAKEPVDAVAKRMKLSEESPSDDGAAPAEAEAAPSEPGGDSKNRHKKEKQRGRNKHRPGMARQAPAEKLCPVLKDVLDSEPERQCQFKGRCHFLHDRAAYAAAKPADLGAECYMFSTHGRCPCGLTCRFGAGHTTASHRSVDGDPERWRRYQALRPTRNVLQKDVQQRLWKRKYDFSAAMAAVQRFDRRPAPAGGSHRPARRPAENGHGPEQGGTADVPAPVAGAPGPEAPVAGAPGPEAPAAEAPGPETAMDAEAAPAAAPEATVAPETAPAPEATPADIPRASPAGAPVCTEAGDRPPPAGAAVKLLGPHSDADLVRLRSTEKKKVVWEDQLYLAPLTTVGNLPFRRLCRRLGADITCGEMAMAANLLQGSQAEWALVRRHHSETVFGAQICGNNPGLLTRCSQLLNETCELDFIDINLGCPIEMVYAQGSGSAMMRKRGMLENTCRSIAAVVDVPLTLKMRTGVQKGVNLAHGLLGQAADWGVDMVTVHGRSR
ncbi:tRNA-dihydrouridine(47) synthase [NAD(P)(+)]-like, partial [Pollicipes pollicipes]|uniref:tRNA-dihydrouridine(47) synthase [NAD(P)(+)]-like n=1 Tax=Pollicipes pollicipes TaxID=41117 RepID=UPI001884AB3C